MRVLAARWLTAAVLAAAPIAAQAPGPPPPPGAVFQPLLADPKEPQFFAAYLWERSPRLAPRLGSVGFGQTIGVGNGRTWQVAIAAAVFSQFNLARPTATRSEEHTSELQSLAYLVCRLLLETKKRDI